MTLSHRRLGRAFALAFVLTACQRGQDNPEARDAAALLPEVHHFDGRPPLRLIERAGDSFSAVSFVVAHELDGVEVTSLVGWLNEQSTLRGFVRLRVHANALALNVEALVESEREAKQFVEFIEATLLADTAALLQSKDGPGIPSGETLPVLPPASAAESVLKCKGELFRNDVRRVFLTETELGTARRLVSRRPSAFAAVGSAWVLDSVRSAIARLPQHPTRVLAPSVNQPALTVMSSSKLSSRLSLALFFPAQVAAEAAERQLLDMNSSVMSRIFALKPNWTLESTGVFRVPGGACVRADWLTASGVSIDESAFALKAIEDELPNSPQIPALSPDTVLTRTLRSTAYDPRDLASEVAWELVTDAAPPISAGMSALLQTSLPSVSRNPPQEVALAPLLARMRNRSAALEQRNLLEQGQSEFWMLVGSTCTQQPSTPLSAATNALWLRAAASFTPVVNGVRIEPWLSTRGLALLGHAAHSGTESPKALATRVANSLGRVLAASRMSIQDFAQLRSQLVTSLSRSADAGWWWGLDAITAHQSWRIEPHTTPNGLAALPLNGLPSSRVWRLAEPLRMATLSNRNPGQAVAAANALGPWLLPFEPGSLTCVDAPALEWRFGEHPIPVEVPHSRGLAYVAIPLSARLPGVAGLVATLLNRSFERTFEPNVEGLRVSAESFNDTNNAVLLVKIATPPADLIQATAQVRSALQNLALGMVTAQDFAWATERLAQLERVRRLDPRFRISELWTAVPSAPIRLSDLQNELGSLRPERHLVVLPAGEIR